MRTWFALFAASIAIVVTVAACGARTGLPIPKVHADADIETETDAGPDVEDAFDAPEEPDVEDPFPDVVVTDCLDAGITYIYLISEQNALLRFYPPDLSVTTIGTLNCPTTSPGNPFSMAVDRSGIAYVLFDNGELFRVSTLTASCKATTFVPGQDGFNSKFGMGFSANKDDPGETLYVAGADLDNPNAISTLGTLDPKTFDVKIIGPVSQYIDNPELTGTGDGRLYGFGPTIPLSHFADIDKPTAKITSDVLLDLDQAAIKAWAFAFWGGDFYFFTAQQFTGSSVVHRYTPGQTTKPPQVADIGLTVVGAGVSTCAPSE
jgi:predicted small lipoprotein YifL